MFKSLLNLGVLSSAGVYFSKKSLSNALTDEYLSSKRNAICILYPDNNSGVIGLVSFS